MSIIHGNFNFGLVEGPLYKAGYNEDGEEIIVCDMWVEAELMVKGSVYKKYVHNVIIPGSLKDEDGPYVNRDQLNVANSLLGKMKERGNINTKYWVMASAEKSLESRWAEEAYYESMIKMGHGNEVPQQYEYLLK